MSEKVNVNYEVKRTEVYKDKSEGDTKTVAKGTISVNANEDGQKKVESTLNKVLSSCENKRNPILMQSINPFRSSKSVDHERFDFSLKGSRGDKSHSKSFSTKRFK